MSKRKSNEKDDELREAVRQAINKNPSVDFSDRAIAEIVRRERGSCSNSMIKKVRLRMVANKELPPEHRNKYRGSKKPGMGEYTTAGGGSVVNPRDGEVITESEMLRRKRAAEMVFVSPDEVQAGQPLFEAATCTITVNSRERSQDARRQCIVAHGTECCICGFSFGAFYGPETEGYIHVHHLNPLSLSDGPRKVNPLDDLRPVCPNCHAAIHLGGKCRKIEEVKEMIEKQRKANSPS